MPTPSPTSRFVAAFNRIDELMRKRCIMEDSKKHDFPAVLAAYEKITYFTARDFLMLANRLRNVIVHEKKDALVELATPAVSVVEKLEEIERNLAAPEKVEKQFVRDSISFVSPGHTVMEVLHLISARAFSQFPVISDGEIVGLLTENGIVRWLASEMGKESLLDFADAKVSEVLAHEENRENMILIGRRRELNEIRLRFIQNPMLEAAVITEAGKASQIPIGILTRWDLIGLKG